MSQSTRKPWVPAAAIAAVTYALIGITFAIPSNYAKMWRLAAWAASAAVYATHILYERLRLRSPHVRAALHIALGVAAGALGVALSANIHSMHIESPSHHRSLLALSLALWPLLTATPAFCVALAASWFLTRATS